MHALQFTKEIYLFSYFLNLTMIKVDKSTFKNTEICMLRIIQNR